MKEVFPLAFYSVDVFVDKKDRVWIIDFNPLPSFIKQPVSSINLETLFKKMNISSVDTIEILKKSTNNFLKMPPHDLLSWNDLLEKFVSTKTSATKNENNIDFRYVESKESAAKTSDVLSAHRVPIELVNGNIHNQRYLEIIVDISYSFR